MQLSKLIIEPRIRTPWSATDLGLLLGRLFWLRSIALYLVMAVPLFVLLHWVFPADSMLPFIILWWLKPLLERPILFMLSHELFSESMTFANTLKNIKSWLLPGMLRILTIGRFSFSRGFYAPIILLEQPKGKDYSNRQNVMAGNYSSCASWLTIVLLHVEGFLLFAGFMLLSILWPSAIDWSAFISDYDAANSGSIYSDMLGLICSVIVAPFYVAAGFILYISKRIELEGWDIEICFRDWMASYSQNHPTQVVEKEVANDA